jgi:hypothetical protein
MTINVVFLNTQAKYTSNVTSTLYENYLFMCLSLLLFWKLKE